MKRKIISTIGTALFFLGASFLDSDGAWMYIAGAMVLAGLVMLYLGYWRTEKNV